MPHTRPQRIELAFVLCAALGVLAILLAWGPLAAIVAWAALHCLWWLARAAGFLRPPDA